MLLIAAKLVVLEGLNITRTINMTIWYTYINLYVKFNIFVRFQKIDFKSMELLYLALKIDYKFFKVANLT